MVQCLQVEIGVWELIPGGYPCPSLCIAGLFAESVQVHMGYVYSTVLLNASYTLSVTQSYLPPLNLLHYIENKHCISVSHPISSHVQGIFIIKSGIVIVLPSH